LLALSASTPTILWRVEELHPAPGAQLLDGLELALDAMGGGDGRLQVPAAEGVRGHAGEERRLLLQQTLPLGFALDG